MLTYPNLGWDSGIGHTVLQHWACNCVILGSELSHDGLLL